VTFSSTGARLSLDRRGDRHETKKILTPEDEKAAGPQQVVEIVFRDVSGPYEIAVAASRGRTLTDDGSGNHPVILLPQAASVGDGIRNAGVVFSPPTVPRRLAESWPGTLRLPLTHATAGPFVRRLAGATPRNLGWWGLAITDEVKVTVAAQACLMLLGSEDHDYFARVPTILVYPSSFCEPLVGDEEQQTRYGWAGLAVYRGPVILAWDAVLEGGRDCSLGCNVVIHEFAHQLDDLDGSVNGTPALTSDGERARGRS
jgi:hypothetical protein